MEYPNSVGENPLVSVCVTTYNHESYIEQCIESIVSQKTNFDFEFLIGEDDSSDGTRTICIEKAKEYPDIIRLQLNDRSNVLYVNGKPTGRNNLKNLFLKARGKYIAFIEGDDFYTDNHKLQKQYEAMEAHPECTVCGTSFSIINQVKNEKKEVILASGIYSDLDVIKGRVSPPTCSLMFKNMPELYFPKWYDLSPFGDFPLMQIHLSKGDLIVLKDNTCTYRVHQQGFYGGVSDINKAKEVIMTMEVVKKYLPQINDRIKPKDLDDRIGGAYYRMSYTHAALGNKKQAILDFFHYLSIGNINIKKTYRLFIFPLIYLNIIKIKPLV